MTLVVAALVAPSDAVAQTRIRIGTLAPQGTSYHRALLEMASKWQAATNGRVQVTIYPGTMGGEPELIRRMRLHQLQAAALTTTGVAAIDPGAGALQLMPMMFRDLNEVDYVREKLGPVLTQRLAQQGYVALFWADAGWVRYFSRDRVGTPDDLKKQKIFVTAGETQQFDMMKKLGFNPVALEWTDALTSLQTHMIDAVPTIPYFALAMQMNTVERYMVDVNWLPLVGALIVSKPTWDALSPADQQAMRTAAAEAGKQFQARGRQESDEAIAAMQKRGLTVVQPTAAELQQWRTLSTQLYPMIRGSLVPADMFDEVVRLLGEYRAHPHPGTD
jgi:TRAP-type C4-dicarboxylate transport system substrate-binding protein